MFDEVCGRNVKNVVNVNSSNTSDSRFDMRLKTEREPLHLIVSSSKPSTRKIGVTSAIVISLLQFGQISIVGTTEHPSLVLMTFPFARRTVGASEKAHPGLEACRSDKQQLRTRPLALRQPPAPHY